LNFSKIVRFLLIIFALKINLLATTLLTYNTYDRDDRVDIMLSFDTPYNGKIFLKKVANGFNITLNNINFNKEVIKNINSPIVNQIRITPAEKNINILIKTKKSINIIASKTTDGFGLRLRAKVSSSMPKTTASKSKPTTDNSFNSLPLDKTGYGNSRYYMVILILVLLLIILWIIKKRVSKPSSDKNWLFKNYVNANEVKILYRKQIDPKNSVLVLSCMGKKYLILTGSSNQLLDKFTSDNSTDESDDDFEQMFAKNRQKLDEFLKVGDDKISSYRDKASLDLSTKED